MRVVLDTNVLVSYLLLNHSIPGRAIRLALDHHTVLVSQATLDEPQPAILPIIGCADGHRELFLDLEKFPSIAGCFGTWAGVADPRDSPRGQRCGDDVGPCVVPADVCASGWHVCGRSGRSTDLSLRLSADECHEAGPGRFIAAFSHAPSDEIGECPTGPIPVMPCSEQGLGAEPACCGSDCRFGLCKNAVWKHGTPISWAPEDSDAGKLAEGCRRITSPTNGGVLCCSDPER